MLPRSTPFTCVIMDDSDIDRLTLQAHVKHHPSLNLVASFANPVDALEFIRKQPVDVIFLDVDTPIMKGTELRRQLMNVPACIFVTSYPDYAIDAFHLDALDFILKPVQGERFAQMISRLEAFMDVRQKAALFEHALGADEIFIKEGRDRIKIRLRDILYLEALKDYTRVVTANRKYCVLGSIVQVLRDPAFGSFVRIHRSYAVQRNYISRYDLQNVYLEGTAERHVLPLGRTYRAEVEALKLGGALR